MGLLPFHLHLARPGSVPSLPLGANFGLLPRIDLTLANALLFIPSDAVLRHKRARSARTMSRGTMPGDLTPPDWERGVERHKEDIGDARMAGASFMSIDTVSSRSGAVNRGGRPVLGRYAPRGGVRPWVRVPGRGKLSQLAIDAFAEPELLVVDAQRVRGAPSLECIRQVLARRKKATIVVVAGPSDLLAIGNELAKRGRLQSTSPELLVPAVVTTILDTDRELRERKFEFASGARDGVTPTVANALALGKAAWWALNQSLQDDPAAEREVGGFLSTCGRLASTSPSEFADVRSLVELISEPATPSNATTRRSAVIQAALRSEGGGRVVVLVRNWVGARTLTRVLSDSLGVTEPELGDLGVEALPFRTPADQRSGTVVLAGYFGRDSIDAALQYRPSRLHAVFDPVEARAAWYGIADLKNALESYGAPGIAVLQAVQDSLASEAPGHVTASGFVPNTCPWEVGNSPLSTTIAPPAAGNVVLLLTDGETVECGLNTRFEVLGRVGGSFRMSAARDLQPGDEIVLVEEDSQAKFSDHLIRILDEGALRPLAEQRASWLMLVAATAESIGLSSHAVERALAQRGVHADKQSIRAWTSFNCPSDAAIPRSKVAFLALAHIVEVPLPDEVLVGMFDAIRRLRTLHRKAGRDLGRAIRLARGGRLSAATQMKLERDWGLSATRLLRAARIGVVDEVVGGGLNES